MSKAEVEISPTCPKCGNLIEPDYCWCGSHKAASHEGHFFVPMGCVCYFSKEEKEKSDK